MIKRLICWLFGHKMFLELFTGKYGHVVNPLTGMRVEVPIKKIEAQPYCLRCGAKLK